MKKYFIFSLVVVLLMSFCSCNQIQRNKKSNELFLNRIFEAGNDVYNQEMGFNHKNIVSDKVEYIVDQVDNEEFVVKINGNETILKYCDTLFYPIGEKKVYRYYANGKKDCTVLIDRGGHINSLLYNFATLDISKTASPNEVKPLLEQKLIELLDISYYENVNIPSATNTNENGFGIYDFLYYNMVDGYMTDYVRVSVTDDGNIFGFSVNILSNDVKLNIDKNLEKEMLNLKLSDIYTTEVTEYVSYNVVFTPQVVVYDGELYIQYSVSANYLHATNGEMTSFLNNILVPLHLITIHS